MVIYQLAAIADTVLVRNVVPTRTAFEQIVFVASGLTSILALLLALLLVVGLFRMRSTATEVLQQLEALLVELRPMARNTTAMSDDVREVAKNVNQMVDESRDTVRVVNERVRSSVVALTDRVDEMSDIVGRVNRSAERVAAAATSAVAGITLGARALGLSKGRKAKKAATPEAPERPRLRRRD